MKDTYPIVINNNPKSWPFINWIMLAIIVVMAFFLFKSCHKTPLPATPTVTPASVIKERIVVDSVASKKFTDAVNKKVDSLEGEVKKWKYETENLQDVNLGLQQDMNEYITNTNIPDTCREFQRQIGLLNKKLSASTAAQSAACNKTVNAQRAVIKQKDILIAKGKEDYTKLRRNADTCLRNQTTLSHFGYLLIKSKLEYF